MFGDDDARSIKNQEMCTSVELADIQLPSLSKSEDKRKDPATPKHLFPNAGCGFGSFNVHLPGPRTGSSVSSMSASQNSNERACEDKIVRNDTSILDKYEMHVAQQDNKL
jgi:hypothetical protein